MKKLLAAVAPSLFALFFASPVLANCLAPDDLLPELEPGEAIFAARDVTLPASAYLGLIAISPKQDGRSDIHLWPDLPNGGVAENHFCGNVSLRPIGEAADGFTRQMAVGLAKDVDYAALYPDFFEQMAATGQFVKLPAGRYRVARFAGKAPLPGAPAFDVAARPSQGCDGHVAVGVRTILFPLC